MEQRQVIGIVTAAALTVGGAAVINGFVTRRPELWGAGAALVAVGFVLWLSLLFTATKITKPSHANVPLYRAIEWIGLRSQWASRYKGNDDEWMVKAEQELVHHAAQGLVTAWGTRQTSYAGTDNAPSALPQDAWVRGKMWFTDWTSPEPPTNLDGHGEARYRDVRFSQAELQSVWPRRSIFARLLRQSPVERSGQKKTIEVSEKERERRGLAIRRGEGWREKSGTW